MARSSGADCTGTQAASLRNDFAGGEYLGTNESTVSVVCFIRVGIWHLHDGFNVYRSRRLTSGFEKLNDRLIRGRNPYSYLDRNVQPSTTYYYKLGDIGLNGAEVLHDPTMVTTPAWGLRTALSLARPSPFRKETTLGFTLAAPAEAKVAVYDVAGRLVRVLAHEELREGDHTVRWDGRDDSGLRVAGGPYFVRLTAGDVTQTRKVVYLGRR